MHTLIAKPGWGSAIIEAEFELAGLPLKIQDLDPTGSAADRERLAHFNPLAQIPTLILPGGQVMTESAAMTLHLADLAPQAGLAPPAGDPARPAFLRWLVFLVAEVYGSFAISDHPDHWVSDPAAQAELLARSSAYRQRLWRMMENAAGKGPWFLGSRFSALDIYIWVMTRWNPRRDWFKVNCPRLHGIALAGDSMPKLAKAMRRNFPSE
ncbi:MAG: glutathione S-transferase family protein [Dongiaceae bacterium]